MSTEHISEIEVSCELTHEWPDDLADSDMILGAEGGAAYALEKSGGFYVITSEWAALDAIDWEDRVGLYAVSTRRFGSAEDRAKYLEYRGWPQPEPQAETHPTDDEAYEEIDDDLANAVERITALEAKPQDAVNKHQPWTASATATEWGEVAAWVDWLNENYELASSHRIPPCWHSHVGASEQLAALWHAWLAARDAQAADIGDHMIAWHERWLWVTLPRVTAGLKDCDIDRHTPPRLPPPRPAERASEDEGLAEFIADVEAAVGGRLTSAVETGRPPSAAEIRIPGLGGAALIVELMPVFERGELLETQRLGIDITLIDPTRLVRYFARPIEASDLRRLAGFLRKTIKDDNPETSHGVFTAERSGLMLSVPFSEGSEVEIDVAVRADDSDPDELDRLNFTTTRAALWGAAQAADAVAETADSATAGHSANGAGGDL